jgi:hypothetical protein
MGLHSHMQIYSRRKETGTTQHRLAATTKMEAEIFDHFPCRLGQGEMSRPTVAQVFGKKEYYVSERYIQFLAL